MSASCLDTRLRTQALFLAQGLGLVAALAGGVTGGACAAVHLAVGTGFFGHGGDLAGAVDGGVLKPNQSAIGYSFESA